MLSLRRQQLVLGAKRHLAAVLLDLVLPGLVVGHLLAELGPLGAQSLGCITAASSRCSGHLIVWHWEAVYVLPGRAVGRGLTHSSSEQQRQHLRHDRGPGCTPLLPLKASRAPKPAAGRLSWTPQVRPVVHNFVAPKLCWDCLRSRTSGIRQALVASAAFDIRTHQLQAAYLRPQKTSTAR